MPRQTTTIPKSQRQKNPTIVHGDVGVEDGDGDVGEVVMDLAKRFHAANDPRQPLVDLLVTKMISKTMIWIPTRN